VHPLEQIDKRDLAAMEKDPQGDGSVVMLKKQTSIPMTKTPSD
jgi:hypothetical protein